MQGHAGDVYTGLDVYSLPEDKLAVLQDKLRILSGLYGLLKPLDLMQPYRLEMGTALQTPKGTSLYQFWGPQIAEYLNACLGASNEPTIVNLASQEYFKAVVS